MTNSTCNVVKNLHLYQKGKPSGIIWVEFFHPDLGEKTKYDNRYFYVEGMQSTWTLIKPVTTQFTINRNKTAQFTRKQFPLRPVAAKTIHRLLGDIGTKNSCQL